MFVALDKALQAKLEGRPRDRWGNPSDPATNPGIRIPIFERRNLAKTDAFDPFRTIPDRWDQVAIFNKKTQGREWEEIFPCVTYDLITMVPQWETWLPPSRKNRVVLAGEGGDVVVYNQYGDIVGSGKEISASRPLGDPLDLMYQIEVHSKIEYEAYFILRALNKVFPLRGNLLVEQADGSTPSFDMSLTDMAILEEETPAYEGSTGGPGDYLYRRYAWTYLIEGFIDTTWPYNKSTHPTITDFQLEITQPDILKARDVDTLEGVLEIIDLTKLMK